MWRGPRLAIREQHPKRITRDDLPDRRRRSPGYLWECGPTSIRPKARSSSRSTKTSVATREPARPDTSPQPGRLARRDSEHVRNGTQNLFAGLRPWLYQVEMSFSRTGHRSRRLGHRTRGPARSSPTARSGARADRPRRGWCRRAMTDMPTCPASSSYSGATARRRCPADACKPALAEGSARDLGPPSSAAAGSAGGADQSA